MAGECCWSLGQQVCSLPFGQGQFRQAYRGHDNIWLVSGSYAGLGQRDGPFQLAGGHAFQ